MISFGAPPAWLQSIHQYAKDNPAMLSGFASGISGPGTAGQNISEAAQGVQRGVFADEERRRIMEDRAREEADRAREEADRASIGGWVSKLPGAEGIPSALASDYAKEYIGRQFGDAPTTGLTPAWGQDADGNWVALQPNNRGQLVRSAVPEGVTPVPPGDLYRARAAGSAQGKAEGEQVAGIPGALSASQEMLSSIDNLLSDPKLDDSVGRARWQTFGGLERGIVGTGPVAEFDSRLNQILGQTYLEAYQELKGGGQITEYEGQKAAQAKSRINENLEPEALRAAAKELRDVLVKGMARNLRNQEAGRIIPAKDNDDLGPWIAKVEAMMGQQGAGAPADDPLGLR